MKRFLISFTALLCGVAAFYFGGGASLLSDAPDGITRGERVRAGLSGVEQPAKPKSGPELEQWYFSEWHYPYGNVLEPEMLDQIWSEVNALPSENSFGVQAVNSWTSLGPYGMDAGAGAKYSGRVLDIETETASSIRVAAASGGLWRYFLLFPIAMTNDLTSQAIGSFATDPNNSDIIFAGTGEPYQRGGTGMFKTVNGGTDWTSVSMSPTPSGFFRVRYRPGNSSIIHAVTTSGYYRSDNGGTSWTRKLTGVASDIAINPSDPTIIYTSLWGDGIYKTTNQGDNWTKLTSGGIPTTNVGRVGLAISASNPAIVYASIAKDDSSNLLGVYKTTNSGTSWSVVSPSNNFLGQQGWYDNVITVSPTNPNIVLAGGVTLWRSANGGSSWSQITSGNIHVDHHAFAWKADGTALWNGNDGGWFHSADAGITWTSAANLLPITQYVNIDVDPRNNMTFAGGSQDNGISFTSDNAGTWAHILGGDGGGVAFDVSTTAANLQRFWITLGVYGGDWTFRRLRTTDHGTNWTHVNTGVDPSGQWYHKIRNDRVALVWLYNNSGPYVYESRNNGDTWEKLNATAFPVEVSNLNVSRYTAGGATIYASLSSTTTGQRLRVYDNGTWFERSTGLTSGLRVRGVGTHPTSPDKAYALMSGLTSGQKVFKTTNRGAAWTNISGDLPNVPAGDLVPHPTNDNFLYLGSEMGCYRTTNGGTNWHRWNNGMPEANIITEMKWIDSVATNGRFYVVAGSYGRGMWKREVSGDDPVDVNEYATVPSKFELAQNYPNPFNPSTTIRFTLPEKQQVTLKVYDLTGREVATLLNEIRGPGSHAFEFSPTRLASGAYFYRLITPRFVETKKMILMK